MTFWHVCSIRQQIRIKYIYVFLYSKKPTVAKNKVNLERQENGWNLSRALKLNWFSWWYEYDYDYFKNIIKTKEFFLRNWVRIVLNVKRRNGMSSKSNPRQSLEFFCYILINDDDNKTILMYTIHYICLQPWNSLPQPSFFYFDFFALFNFKLD